MEIIRVENRPRNSLVDGTAVEELPSGLRRRMVRLLNHLPRVNRIVVPWGESKEAIFELSGGINVTLDFFPRVVQREFQKIMKLWRWWQDDHWHIQSRSRIGGPVQCAHCYYSTVAGGHSQYCPEPSCSSHTQWRKIIGPSYEPPKENPHTLRLSAELEEAMRGPKGSRRGLRRIGGGG